MPYASAPPRRFFHAAPARSHSLTPAMVHAWAEAEKRANAPAGLASAPKAPAPPKPAAISGTGGYQQSFLDGSAAAAQRSSTDKIEAAKPLTMPITR